VPLPANREQDMKLSPEFTRLKRQLLDRIRETSGMKTDLDKLQKLTQVTDERNLE
jgi:NitT/TauT family transport system ATP-binding protein